MSIWFCLIVSFALGLGISTYAPPPSLLNQAVSQDVPHVIESLPPPNDKEIRKIRRADEWRNPFVIVNADGYELILNNEQRRPVLLTLDELEQTLLKLPLERWPLGKVIAVAENGLRSPGDNPQIASNVKALIRMLKSHKLRVDQWPAG